jgi:heme/copper-type cytochrome/quinol oxidase subunit 2
MSPTAVAVLIIVLILGIIGFDTYLALDKVKANTYSAVIRAAGKKWMPLIMIVSFSMGLLCGHWWW